ncbi:MAG: hypothetical protein JW915_09790 [Chitinispirillaceae bacterium]|nr:hypothetical protein [Chitinispirillaceae bacterium]
MKFFSSLSGLLTRVNARQLFSSGFKLSGIILLIVIVIVTLFLFTGRVFVELFGCLVLPFPRRKKNKPD